MRLKSLRDDEADYFGAAAGLDDDRGVTGDTLVDLGEIGRDDVAGVERRRRETGETFADAALALGLIDRATLGRAVERQQHFHILAPDDDRVDQLVVAAFDPSDPLSQAARRLRGAVSAATNAEGEPLRLLTMLAVDTRAEAGLVAANLAVACAQTGYRTLLVDANLDDPVQHDLFHVSNLTGLSVLLAQQAPDAVQVTAINGLSVLPAGPAVRNFAEMLDRGALHGRLRDLAGEFDLVLVDASHADAAIAVAAAQGADRAMIVVRRDDSSMRQLTALIDGLHARGTAILGTVLTD